MQCAIKLNYMHFGKCLWAMLIYDVVLDAILMPLSKVLPKYRKLQKRTGYKKDEK